MQEPTDFPGFSMQNALPTILPTDWISKPPLSPHLQMPPVLLVPYQQMTQRPLLPDGLQIVPGPLMPHNFQRLEDPQTSPGSPVNPGFQDFPVPLAPPVAPQVLPIPHVPRKAPIRERRGCFSYSPEQKKKLENFFFEKTKYPSFKQRQELAQNICVIEHQIRIWFKNKRSRYFRKHPQERLKPPGNQGRRADTQGTSTGDH